MHLKIFNSLLKNDTFLKNQHPMKAVFFFYFAVISLFLSAQSSLQVKQYQLDNGLTVILNEDHSRPEVFGVVVVKAGSKNDPADATGMAHYQEHMLFKGTGALGTTNWELEKPHIEAIFRLYDELGATRDEAARQAIQQKINEESLKANEYAIPNELSNVIKAMGGTQLNANTGPDRTVYFNAFPSNQLEKWLELYSHRFMDPVFRGFQSELEVVYEEKNLYSDMFQFSLIEEFNKNAFRNHPYGQQSMIGTLEDLKNPSLTKMYDFFKTYYVANNMALVLSGDFNTEEVMPLIREKFGRLSSGQVPAMKKFPEQPFNGRELVEKRLSPIKIALLGFRTVPNGHPDEIALEVCNGILFNNNETGLLNTLAIDNKLLASIVLPMTYNDYGLSIMFIVPKIVGQSLEDAEKLVMTEVRKLANGEFDESLIDVVKNQLYVQYQKNLESLQNRAVLLAENFGQDKSLDAFLAYPELVRKVTKADVLRVAKTYYGDNYLAFFSKMGISKKDKIEKPGYKPVISNTDARSEFVKKLESMPVAEPRVKFIDFNTDLYSGLIRQGVMLYHVTNPLNDIFSLEIIFGAGDHQIPLLKYAASLMGYSGVEGFKVSEFKKEFAKIGCTYSISSDESYTTLMLEGLESNLPQALKLVNLLVTRPELEKDKLDIIMQAEKTNRKVERSEPDNVSEALFQYVRLGEQSPYLDRLSMKEIGELQADSLVAAFINATGYACEIHFSGKTSPADLSKIILSEITFNQNLEKGTSPYIPETKKYLENTVFFTDKKKAVQSKIYLYANGPEFNKELQPAMEAFNLYFGGDFSGLVLQEIREYRSLAYGAGAGFSIPLLAGKPADFTGYVGTQADKTSEALNVFTDLIRKMPGKTERMDMIKQYLALSALTKRPGFRNLSQTVVKWKQLGYTEDPLKFKMEKYQSLRFEDIISFYRNYLENKAVAYSIVGNPKKISPEVIQPFGKVIRIKEDKLFR